MGIAANKPEIIVDQLSGSEQSAATLNTQLCILREKISARDDYTETELALLSAVDRGIDNLLASAHCAVASGLLVAEGGLR